MIGPVRRKKQKITSPYGPRKNHFHRGVDLRSVNFLNRKLQPCVATEDSIVLRAHRDKKDNGVIVLKPCVTKYDELKYIHVCIENSPVRNMIGEKIKEGQVIGYTERRGQSKRHHLHFETWIEGKHFDPTIYFDDGGIEYG